MARSLTLLLLALCCLVGCAGKIPEHALQQQIVVAREETPDTLVRRMAPAFVLQGIDRGYNRIAAVRATGYRDAESIVLDPDMPVLYAGHSSFSTANGTYTNLIYRVHFAEQPFSLIPFHLTAGKHPGLLIILTLDERQQVLLVTTAHTCGCYAVSIPTQNLPHFAYPTRWPQESIDLYGETLPARLPPLGRDDLLLVAIRPEVHRVMGLQVVSRQSLPGGKMQTATVRDLESLKNLSLDDGSTTSLYYQRWPLAGHVKGALKPWETLLLSVVSLDLFIGMDKEYGDTTTSGNPFYTSLKPWNRYRSDMNTFPAYLHFNGWRL